MAILEQIGACSSQARDERAGELGAEGRTSFVCDDLVVIELDSVHRLAGNVLGCALRHVQVRGHLRVHVAEMQTGDAHPGRDELESCRVGERPLARFGDAVGSEERIGETRLCRQHIEYCPAAPVGDQRGELMAERYALK